MSKVEIKTQQNSSTDNKPKRKKVFKAEIVPENSRFMPLWIRLIIGALLFITGFNFSNSLYFNENPLFGVEFLAEVLISYSGLLVGLYLVPNWFFSIKYWLERLVFNAVSEIVSNFWTEQSKRLKEAQLNKNKQKNKEANERNKLKVLEDKLKSSIDSGILLDTSALIDGRVYDIAKAGFILDPLLITKSVLNELHLISDSQDALKRQRGRRGLDIINSLKKVSKVKIIDDIVNLVAVDEILVETAKKLKLRLMTVDFNLNKVAQVRGVKVLNINDLANVVKTVVLPGEEMNIKIIQEGKEKNQGVGYLADGTMVVVDDAKQKIGENLDVKVYKIIQSPAGKMIFSSFKSN